ncbi:hypothetical protein BLNAU_23570 [Blattamonas nauphoetae]|uniref:Uncharacterized protein n=1 Tax=Blattamonas nauphoetae TaxID=2049346 RepID=A0ABQ9WQ99_9EUKA|nr:hypothetical protein BLNAU_23570 [Blattamonas nauphoetae]
MKELKGEKEQKAMKEQKGEKERKVMNERKGKKEQKGEKEQKVMKELKVKEEKARVHYRSVLRPLVDSPLFVVDSLLLVRGHDTAETVFALTH